MSEQFLKLAWNPDNIKRRFVENLDETPRQATQKPKLKSGRFNLEAKQTYFREMEQLK